MALDWANERWVRLYTRETPDQAAWDWQARALWPWLLARVDGAGVIETKGAKGLAAIVRLPLEVVELGIAALIEDGCVVPMPRGYVIRNFIEAQTTKSSTNRRQAAVRELDRALTAIAAAAAGMTATANVAATTEESHAVTAGHTESRQVTPCHSEPSRAEPKISLAPAGARDPGAPAPAPAPEPAPGEIGRLVDLAVDTLNAARAKLDPDSRPIGEHDDQPGREQLRQRLRATSSTTRELDLRLALTVLIAECEVTGEVGNLRLGMLGGPSAWPRLLAGSKKPRARDGPAGPRSPPRGQAPIATAHRIGPIPLDED